MLQIIYTYCVINNKRSEIKINILLYLRCSTFLCGKRIKSPPQPPRPYLANSRIQGLDAILTYRDTCLRSRYDRLTITWQISIALMGNKCVVLIKTRIKLLPCESVTNTRFWREKKATKKNGPEKENKGEKLRPEISRALSLSCQFLLQICYNLKCSFVKSKRRQLEFLWDRTVISA